MGKAGKWILNFLVGKKDEKHSKKKKICSSFSAENLIASRDSQTMKLKWSFRKTTSNLKTHKVSKSIDSIDTKKALKQAMAEQKKQLSEVQSAAATKIQSAYRSHLARKALQALRGLVKLQALVRGHLVRKQTAATLKSMQALMAIQVRARVNRIQMVEEELRLSTHRHFFNNHGKGHKERQDINLGEYRRHYKSRSGYLSRPQIERTENELDSYSSKRVLSISKRQNQYENYSIFTEPNTSHLMSKQNAENPSFSMHQPRHSDSVPYDYHFYPNYMAKTESSKAKVRSQSEPKQRPGSTIRPKSKQMEIVDGMRWPVTDQIHNTLEDLEHMGYENHSPWFMKLYQLTHTSKSRSGDSIGIKHGDLDGKNFNVAHEPYLTMY